MSRIPGIVTAIAVMAAALGTAGAQAPPGRGHSGHAHQAGAPGGDGHHARVQACMTEFDSVVRDGRGFGLAFAADQNGYPGPLHVLELKDRLRLTAHQEATMRRMLDDMLAEARPKGARLLDAEARLRALFADGRADEGSVRAAVAEVEKHRNDVRLVHLLTHLRAREVLTEEQRAAYQQARWPVR